MSLYACAAQRMGLARRVHFKHKPISHCEGRCDFLAHTSRKCAALAAVYHRVPRQKHNIAQNIGMRSRAWNSRKSVARHILLAGAAGERTLAASQAFSRTHWSQEQYKANTRESESKADSRQDNNTSLPRRRRTDRKRAPIQFRLKRAQLQLCVIKRGSSAQFRVDCLPAFVIQILKPLR